MLDKQLKIFYNTKPKSQPNFKLRTKLLFRLAYKLKYKYPIHFNFLLKLYKEGGVNILRDNSIPPTSQPTYEIKDKLLAEKLTIKILNYLNNGALIGPFFKSEIPFDNYFISPLCGLWKKKPTKVSLIHNLSAPLGNSINSTIPKLSRKTNYPSFERLVEIAFHVVNMAI